VTNKGIYYEPGKEPAGPEAPPKLHLLVESNDEMKVWFMNCAGGVHSECL
jgi:ATP-dependent RNA helicase DDX46/PRP5